jgi:hypothetical protein
MEQVLLDRIISNSDQNELDNLFKQRRGQAELFVDHHSHSIKAVNESEDGAYYYSDATGLWTKRNDKFFANLITKWFDIHIADLIPKHPNKAASLAALQAKLRSNCAGREIWKQALPDLLDRQFEPQLDASRISSALRTVSWSSRQRYLGLDKRRTC